MAVHPAVLRQAGKFWAYLPVVGCLAAGVFAWSLARCLYPGYSAVLLTEAAGLASRAGPEHPLFSLLARGAASLFSESLVVGLNAFSAFWGVVSALLLFLAVGRLVLFAASEDGGGASRNSLADVTDDAAALSPEIVVYNRRVFRIAVASAFVAVFLFLFLAPTWFASTRLESGSFNMALLLGAWVCYPAYRCGGRWARQVLALFLFGLGLFECTAFVLLIPVLGYVLMRDFLHAPHRAPLVCVSLVAGLGGAVLGGAACLFNTAAPAGDGAGMLLSTVLHDAALNRLAELRFLLPASGWLLILVQTAVPLSVLAFGQQLLFKDRRPNTLAAMVLVLVCAAPTLLKSPWAPFALYQFSERMPVFGALVAAAAVACVFGACLVFIGPAERQEEADLTVVLEYARSRQAALLRGLAAGCLAVTLLLLGVAPFRNGPAVRPEQGDFADRLAREVLDVMGPRTCLVTSGLLDNHLRVLAHTRGRPLTLVPVRARSTPKELDDIRAFAADSPIFDGQNRQRLANALLIGPARFVMEWFNGDPLAGQHAMILATPDLWTACGAAAVPEGLAFAGVRGGDGAGALPSGLAQRNWAFADRVAPWLARRETDIGYVGQLRGMLRMRAGFALNELGVLFEDRGRYEDAYTSYMRAAAVDPVNVSAVVNAYALTALRSLHPEAGESLQKRMKTALATARVNYARDVMWVLQNHGTIRQQAFYAQQTAQWSLRGVRSLAADKLRRAKLLAEHAGVTALLDNAAVYLQTGDAAKAEACLLAVLGRDAENRDALIGLCTVKLALGQSSEAEKRLQDALAAGVEPLALRYQSITVALLKGSDEQALKLLQTATKEVPTDPRYWAMLADLLLKRGDTQFVERQLLLDMRAAFKSNDHYLIHAIRGLTLRAKGPAFHREARLELLMALELNAALPEVWDALLRLDLAISNSAFTESDVRRKLSLEPDHAFANYLMGALLLSRGKLPEAEDFLRRSTEKTPTAEAHNDWAECLRRMKRLDDAEKSARRALELQPGLLSACDTLANVLCDAGRHADAEPLAAKAVAAEPAFAPFQVTALRVEIGLRKREAAQARVRALEGRGADVPDDLRKAAAALR